jgi:transketolase
MKFSSSIELAKEARKLTLKMVHTANASHIGGAFSMIDILSVLYQDVLTYNARNADWDDRDRFLLSKGHACSSLYAILGLCDFYNLKLLDDYAANGSYFISHISHKIPGVEISSGSLGHGLSIACGLAISAKRKAKKWKVICLISDGELNEGSIWEALLFAAHHCLDNLILIVDYNKIQSLGFVEEVIKLEPLNDKFLAFGWDVFTIDGHNHDEIRNTLHSATLIGHKPKAIIANTIKGKGVSFMENSLLWHYKSPDDSQLKSALEEINNS